MGQACKKSLAAAPMEPLEQRKAAAVNLEVTVQTLGGETVLQATLPTSATPANIREQLISIGEKCFELVHDGKTLSDYGGDLAELGIKAGDVITLVRGVGITITFRDLSSGLREVLKAKFPQTAAVADLREELISCRQGNFELRRESGEALKEGPNLAQLDLRDGTVVYIDTGHMESFGPGGSDSYVWGHYCSECGQRGPALDNAHLMNPKCLKCGHWESASGDSCFTGDSILTVRTLQGLVEPRSMAQIKEGDVVCIGHEAEFGSDCYRRVTRVWSQLSTARICTLSTGCRLTAGHPVWWDGEWQAAEAVKRSVRSSQQMIYNLELEGHVDTVDVGGFKCATLGLYCGEQFGWNVWTRKTTPCDFACCPRCEKAVLRDLDFNNLSHSSLNATYEPY